MDVAAPLEPAAPPPFRQPRPVLRWAGVALALAGWLVSQQLFSASVQKTPSRLLSAVCGGGRDGVDDCTAVLTSPYAYVRLSERGEMSVPVSAFGMIYFAFVALWYLFIGPPTHAGRWWHIVITAVVLYGAWQSLDYTLLMANTLQRWCAGCLVAHGLNAGLLVVTLASWPWGRGARQPWVHPGVRLALATLVTGAFAFFATLAYSVSGVVSARYQDLATQYRALTDDPEFARWDYERQPAVEIPLYDNEVFAGNPEAPHTLVVFGDFQRTACRESHRVLQEVAKRYGGQLRVAFRYFPQDPACNPEPHFRSGGHASACRAAQAAEAACQLGGREAYLAMRGLIWDNQDRLPKVPLEVQSAAERTMFAEWAAQLGLERSAFAAALDSAAVQARIKADIALATRLGLRSMPVIYLDGKPVRHWRNPKTWDALLGAPASAPATSPAP